MLQPGQRPIVAVTSFPILQIITRLRPGLALFGAIAKQAMTRQRAPRATGAMPKRPRPGCARWGRVRPLVGCSRASQAPRIRLASVRPRNQCWFRHSSRNRWFTRCRSEDRRARLGRVSLAAKPGRVARCRFGRAGWPQMGYGWSFGIRIRLEAALPNTKAHQPWPPSRSASPCESIPPISSIRRASPKASVLAISPRIRDGAWLVHRWRCVARSDFGLRAARVPARGPCARRRAVTALICAQRSSSLGFGVSSWTAKTAQSLLPGRLGTFGL